MWYPVLSEELKRCKIQYEGPQNRLRKRVKNVRRDKRGGDILQGIHRDRPKGDSAWYA